MRKERKPSGGGNGKYYEKKDTVEGSADAAVGLFYI